MLSRQVSEAKTFRGLNREGIIAASIYISARINNYPRTAKEIATIFNLDNTSATKGCKNALSIINKIALYGFCIIASIYGIWLGIFGFSLHDNFFSSLVGFCDISKD